MTHFEIGDSARAACGGEGFLSPLSSEVTCRRCRSTRYFSAMRAADQAADGAAPQERGWLPIVLCPTDGVDRTLLLPDGREVVGAHHNPGGWRVCSTIERDVPVFDTQRRGLLPLDPTRKASEEARRQVGTQKGQMRLYGPLPDGVYPTHFRPNDTVFGAANHDPEETAHGE